MPIIGPQQHRHRLFAAAIVTVVAAMPLAMRPAQAQGVVVVEVDVKEVAEGFRNVLENVLHDKASDLVAQRFPASSLVLLHLGSGDGPVDRVLPRYLLEQDSPALMSDGEQVDEFDEVPEAGAPLRVAFSMDGKRQVVDVIGLTTVVGQPARVPHALKPTFDETKPTSWPPKIINTELERPFLT